MTGNLAQIIALTTFGNCYLKGGNPNTDFYPKNSAFQYCKSVDFRQIKKSIFSSKPSEIVVAKDPIEWFRLLKRDGCIRLRLLYFHSSDQSFAPDHMMAGLAGGGGQWYIETDCTGRFDYWAERWKVTDSQAADKLIWTVNYGLVKSQNRSDHTKRDVTECKAKLATVLTEIAEFAVAEELPHFAKEFEMAKAALESDAPERDYYHDDIVCSGIYSLLARQVIHSTGRAWVFGGMGSWNDIGFEDKKTNERYEQLSAKLYDAINEGIMAAVDLD